VKEISFAAACNGMDEMERSYRSGDIFMALCRECPNYGANWACPPFDFDVPALLKKFGCLYVFGAKVTHPEEVVRSADTYEKSMEYTGRIFKGVKVLLSELLRTLEDRYPGGLGLSAGRCDACPACARGEGRPCRFPDRCRHSLESMGFDVAAIAENMLGTRLLWTKGALPEYQMFINGFLAAREDDGIMKSIESYLGGLASWRP
jgi:predicted metal-binding protein